MPCTAEQICEPQVSSRAYVSVEYNLYTTPPCPTVLMHGINMRLRDCVPRENTKYVAASVCSWHSVLSHSRATPHSRARPVELIERSFVFKMTIFALPLMCPTINKHPTRCKRASTTQYAFALFYNEKGRPTTPYLRRV